MDVAPSNTSADEAVRRSAKRTAELFGSDYLMVTPSTLTDSSIGVSYRRKAEYEDVKELPSALAEKQAKAAAGRAKRPKTQVQAQAPVDQSGASMSLVKKAPGPTAGGVGGENQPRSLIQRPSATKQQPPEWHPPWKLMRVISGHLGWVRSLAVEPNNEWFASGAGDRTIKIWNLATGGLRLTLTGHISTVRGLAVSPRHPYLFSCGEDKMVKCWDL